MHVRTVWRNLARARIGELLRRSRDRFEITEDIRTLLAYLCGNIKVVHREPARNAQKSGVTPVSLSTLHRTAKRDLTPGDRAGLKSGIPASCGHDPHLCRPPTARNEAATRNGKASSRLGMGRQAAGQTVGDLVLTGCSLFVRAVDRGSNRVLDRMSCRVQGHEGRASW
ncbi:hypothetical protein ACF1GW_29550 [Streptomyces achromogenes]|uniref:hypothetical protein n=1 Tax=Streptomyces achromogenes TaxID=67255 RepID=UPI0036F82334